VRRIYAQRVFAVAMCPSVHNMLVLCLNY